MGLVGRAAELAILTEAMEADRPISVVGEAGIGKTALVRAATEFAGRQVREGGGFSTLAWMPHLPLQRAINSSLSGDADWVAATVERAVGPDVLFIDDLQWADPATCDVIERLVGRVALVVAVRTGDPGTDQALVRSRAWAAQLLPIGPLDSADAALVARARRPDLRPRAIERIVTRAGGNPLLVEELAGGGPEDSLALAMRARVARLSPELASALALIALADRPLAAGVEPAVSEKLVALGLAVQTSGGVGVRHALLRDAVLDELGSGERRALHAQLGGLLEKPGERARHLAAAGEPTAAHRLALDAVGASATPGERAAHLGVAAATADGPEADALRIEAAAALRTSGDLDGALALLDAVDSNEPEVAGRAAAVRARVHWSRGDPSAMRAAIDGGLRVTAGTGTPGEAALRAEAVVLTALVDGRFDDGLAESEEAIRLSSATGADPTRALLLRATILTGLGRDGWIDALEAVVEAARATGDVETEMSAANNLVTGHEMYGRPDDGRRLAEAMSTRAHELHLASWERQFNALLVNLDLHAGRLPEALARAEALLEEALDPLTRQQVGMTAALALVDLARFGEAESLLEALLPEASDDVSGRGDVLWVLAEAALWGGRPLDALRRVEEYRAYESSEYPNSHLVDATAAWAAIEAGRRIPAVLAHAEPLGMTVGSRFERRALERLADDDPVGAASLFDAAATTYAGFHARGELRSRWAAAEARRLSGDADRARRDLEALEDALADAGFLPILARVHRSLRLLGARRAVRRGPADPSARLTAREHEVSDLVARGLSNIEIARRLGVGRPTVARLLASAMAKLGVDSRAQVAAQVV